MKTMSLRRDFYPSYLGDPTLELPSLLLLFFAVAIAVLLVPH